MAEPGADGGDTGTGTDGCFLSGTSRKMTPKSRPRPRHKKSASRDVLKDRRSYLKEQLMASVLQRLAHPSEEILGVTR